MSRDFCDREKLPCGLWITVEREGGHTAASVTLHETDNTPCGAETHVVEGKIGWDGVWWAVRSLHALTRLGVLDLQTASPADLQAHGGFAGICKVEAGLG